jgi:hypothetical protein
MQQSRLYSRLIGMPVRGHKSAAATENGCSGNKLPSCIKIAILLQAIVIEAFINQCAL